MALHWPTPGFEGRTFELLVLNRCDLNFCLHSSPVRGTTRGMHKYGRMLGSGPNPRTAALPGVCSIFLVSDLERQTEAYNEQSYRSAEFSSISRFWFQFCCVFCVLFCFFPLAHFAPGGTWTDTAARQSIETFRVFNFESAFCVFGHISWTRCTLKCSCSKWGFPSLFNEKCGRFQRARKTR